ncbi:MAG: serine/threonine protein kinase [Acidobacteria bacterium]|nr:serine/threonine protein kinase [Acidobacteriota bacterium]
MTSVAEVLGGRYRIVRLLGRGGMSDVYEAFDIVTGDSVAIKVVRSGDPDIGRRLSQEARALESFQHPGLIRLLDIGETGDQSYLVMELITGTTLAQTLRAGALSSRETANLGARLADALSYVHERGVVHRDVKPSNVLLSNDGDPWLGDFGIAMLHDASVLTATGATMGTVSYMAPEQLEDHQVGPAADIWSLGIILLECLTGRRVYEGTPSEVLARRLAGPVVVPERLAIPWRLVLAGMLSHQPEERLKGSEVAALLASSAYDAPTPVPDSDITTQLSAGVVERTQMMPGVVLSGAALDDTRVVQHSPTVQPRPRVNKWYPRLGGLVGLAAVMGVAFYLSASSPPLKHPPTTTSPPTTTTVLAGTAALQALQSQVNAGEVAGTINRASGDAITQPAFAAQSAYTTGATKTAATDLALASSAISGGVLNHTIGPVEGQLLQEDLALLASALNLSSAVTPPTTTTTTTTSPTLTIPTFPSFGNPGGPGNSGRN